MCHKDTGFFHLLERAFDGLRTSFVQVTNPHTDGTPAEDAISTLRCRPNKLRKTPPIEPPKIKVPEIGKQKMNWSKALKRVFGHDSAPAEEPNKIASECQAAFRKLSKAEVSKPSVALPEQTDEQKQAKHDARYWGPIRSISDEAFIKLLLRHLDLEVGFRASRVHVTGRKEGTFHHVAILMLPGGQRYVVKVPAVGWKDRWTEADAHVLRSEALTMRYIRRHTKMPIPAVVAFDDTMDNEINAPYIIMEFVKGRPAHHLWFGPEWKGGPDWSCKSSGSESGQPRDQKRENFLRSLANAMAELRHLKFDKIGMLSFENGEDNPTVGSYWGAEFAEGAAAEDEGIAREPYERPAVASSKQYYITMLEEVWGKDEDPQCKGINMIMQCVFNSRPFCKSKAAGDKEESFVLTHNDLDFQNIYTDDAGNITGIIDWDGVSTVPRCVGYAAVPEFLREDWSPRYDYPSKAIHSPMQLEQYRERYSRAMQEAMGETSDAMYTEMSAVYCAAHNSLFAGGDTTDFIKKVFVNIADLRFTDAEEFEEMLGEGGWDHGEAVIRERIPRFLEP